MTQTDDVLTVDERYASAINAKNLFMATDRAKAPDVLVAAAWAWSAGRLGSALLRLHSEFDGAQHPRKQSQALIRQIADGLLGSAGQRLAVAQGIAHQWHLHESMLLLQRLKSLPNVRYQLALRAETWGMTHSEDKAAAALLWWLDPTCPYCHGIKYEQIPGTPNHNGRHCRGCHGSGKTEIPDRGDGRRLQDWIDTCLRAARSDIKKRLR